MKCIYFSKYKHVFLQEKRGNREEERLNKIKSQLSEMKDQYLPETQTALDTYLANIQAKSKTFS